MLSPKIVNECSPPRFHAHQINCSSIKTIVHNFEGKNKTFDTIILQFSVRVRSKREPKEVIASKKTYSAHKVAGVYQRFAAGDKIKLSKPGRSVPNNICGYFTFMYTGMNYQADEPVRDKEHAHFRSHRYRSGVMQRERANGRQPIFAGH